MNKQTKPEQPKDVVTKPPSTVFYYNFDDDMIGVGANGQVAWMKLVEIKRLFDYAKGMYILKGLDFDGTMNGKDKVNDTIKE